MTLYKRTTTVQQWYGNSVSIPSLDSPRFYDFAASCMGLAASILEKKTDRNLRVATSENLNTAYADPKRGLVVISQNFMRGNFSAIGQNKLLGSTGTIGAILGVIVHEIGHFAYSPVECIKEGTDYIEQQTTRQYDFMLARRIVNTLEDIYIEYQIANLAPNLAWTLDQINKLMLTDEKFSSSSKILRQLAAINGANDSNNVLNFLLFAKVTKDPGKVSLFVKKVFALARSVVRMTKAQQRYDLALRLYEILAPEKANQLPGDDIESNEGEEESFSSGNGESNEGEESNEESNEDSANNIAPGSDGEYTEPIQVIDGFGNVAVPLTVNIIEQPSIQVNGGLDGHKIHSSTVTMSTDSTIEMDERFTKIADYARARATAKTAYSEQRENGRHMRQLHRASIDGKIFANKLPNNALLPLDVIVLVDCSGSMNYLCEGQSEVDYDKRITKLESALRASYGAAVGFLNGRCSVSVFAHASDCDPKVKKTVHIYELYRSGEPVKNLARRAAYMNNHKWQFTGYNRDGYAILEAAKKFQPTSTRQKVLIVISDGAPNGRGSDYDSWQALDHTRGVVDQLRKNGIKVYSLSIDSGAYRTNNYIYGEENNTCATDANAITEIMNRLFA